MVSPPLTPSDEPVVADSDGFDNGLVAAEDDGAGRGAGGGQIPQPRGMVLTPGDEPVVVGADGDGVDTGIVAAEDDGAGRGAGGGQIPQ